VLERPAFLGIELDRVRKKNDAGRLQTNEIKEHVRLGELTNAGHENVLDAGEMSPLSLMCRSRSKLQVLVFLAHIRANRPIPAPCWENFTRSRVKNARHGAARFVLFIYSMR
jgi:hypothetical protein